MTEAVRRLLLAVANGGEIPDAVRGLWPSPAVAWPDLAAAFEEESLGEDSDSVMAVLRAALLCLGRPVVGHLCHWFTDAEDAIRVNLALTFAELGAAAAEAVPLLVEALADAADARGRFSLRNAAAHALGEIGEASEAVVGVLGRVAGDRTEPQPLRSYCIEALMDLGPPAAAAIPVLERVLRDDAEDDDLRHFAWSAVKVIGGRSTAEHVRSLYRAVRESGLDRSGNADARAEEPRS